VIGPSSKTHDVAAHAHDGGYDANIDPISLEARALLDMRFEIRAMALPIEARQGAVAQSELLQAI
jgi:hypothetical protein